jgi:hypothetical protein
MTTESECIWEEVEEVMDLGAGFGVIEGRELSQTETCRRAPHTLSSIHENASIVIIIIPRYAIFTVGTRGSDAL